MYKPAKNFGTMGKHLWETLGQVFIGCYQFFLFSFFLLLYLQCWIESDSDSKPDSDSIESGQALDSMNPNFPWIQKIQWIQDHGRVSIKRIGLLHRIKRFPF